MIRQLNLGKNVRNLFLRYVMICVFVFMCIVLIATNAKLLGPLFGIFYFGALIYYFWFTMKVEGELDVNRVSIGQMPYCRWKGAICALILAIPLIILNFIPNFFADPQAEYASFFTGQVTALTETDRFNVDLKAASGEKGYVSEILFQENRTLDKLVYVTDNGYFILCDGTVKDADQQYAASKNKLTLDTKPGEDVVYFTSDTELSDEESEAFTQCRNALNDIKSVMGEYSLWEKVFSVIKVIFAVSLQYFCSIFTDNVMIGSVIYAACMLVLCAAAQVGYEMGYRNLTFLRKKKPQIDRKAGDSVVIQRGGANRDAGADEN